MFRSMRVPILALLGLISVSKAQAPATPVPVPGFRDIPVAELVEPLIVVWTGEYQKTDPSFDIKYQSVMNSVVTKAFVEGKSALAPCARELSDEETKAFTAKWGYAPTRIAVAMDALAVIVHKGNPIKEIRIEQLDAIYGTSRLQGWPKDVTVWGDLGLTASNWANRPIRVFGHPIGSGTRDFFVHEVQVDGPSKGTITRGSDILAMLEELMADQSAIGYGSISQVYTSLKAVPLIPRGGKAPVEATPANVASGAYPLGRILYFYVNRAPGKSLDPSLAGFLRFALSKEGQHLVQAAGFAALPEDLAQINAKRLDR
jgi:phosphate transport system substrate-binding protein